VHNRQKGTDVAYRRDDEARVQYQAMCKERDEKLDELDALCNGHISPEVKRLTAKILRLTVRIERYEESYPFVRE